VTNLKNAFWNLGNLFDTKPNEIIADLEFTPEKGWTNDSKEKKLKI